MSLSKVSHMYSAFERPNSSRSIINDEHKKEIEFTREDIADMIECN